MCFVSLVVPPDSCPSSVTIWRVAVDRCLGSQSRCWLALVYFTVDWNIFTTELVIRHNTNSSYNLAICVSSVCPQRHLSQRLNTLLTRRSTSNLELFFFFFSLSCCCVLCCCCWSCCICLCFSSCSNCFLLSSSLSIRLLSSCSVALCDRVKG